MRFGMGVMRRRNVNEQGTNLMWSYLLASIGMLSVGLTAVCAAEPLQFLSAEAAPDWDKHFQRTSGWLGADGNYAIRIAPDRVLWFFSDTLVGRVEQGRRVDCQMINNSVGVQTESPDGVQLEFFYRTEAEGPGSIFSPDTAGRWYWPVGGVLIDGKIHLLLWEFEKTNDSGAFGFHQTGVTHACIENPLDSPLQWKVVRRPLPFFVHDEKQHLQFGSSVLEHEGMVYIYGTRQDLLQKGSPRQMLVARVPSDQLECHSSWEFRTETDWGRDVQAAVSVAEGVATEYSVTPCVGRGDFLLITHGDQLSPRIEARVSASPWGPWSSSMDVWTTPEPARNRRCFTYSGKAQPALSSGGEILVTYAANSFEFGDLFADSTLYWPRFVRITLKTDEASK